MRAIINGKIILKDKTVENKVVIFDKKIKHIIEKEDFYKINNILEKLDIIDADGCYVSPGFIDLHIHGSGGSDAMDGTLKDLKIISQVIAQKGVTGFLPTTMTMSKEKIYKALNTIKEGMDLDLGGAKVLGAHMEGPFINSKYKGVQDEKYIIKPSYDFINGYEKVIKIITLAPEKDYNFEFIKKVKENTSIVLSIGHSDAIYEEVIEAIKNGISHATHLFNAMSPLHHRKPGVVGAVLSSDINCEFIADKIHIHPGVFELIINAKGPNKVILVTDSMRAECMKNGISELGGQKVIVKDNLAMLEDGTLAGSVLTLNRALKKVLENTKLKIHEVVAMASSNAARNIGIDKRKGSIELGKDADITIFDEEFEIKHTIVEGRTVFSN